MGIPSITHQLVAANWTEGQADAVGNGSGLFWRVIASEGGERGRFLVSWIGGAPETAFVIDRDGAPLLDPDILDTAAGIASLWEADNPCRSPAGCSAVNSVHAPAASVGEGVGE